MIFFSSNRTSERMQGKQEQPVRAEYPVDFMKCGGINLDYIKVPNKRPFSGPNNVALAWILPQPEQPADVKQSTKTFALTTKGLFGEVRATKEDDSLISHRFIRVPKLLDDVFGKPLDSIGTTAGALIGATTGETVRVVKVDANLQAIQVVDEGTEAYEPASQTPLSTEVYLSSAAA